MSRFTWPLIVVIGLVLFLHLGLQHGDPRALPSPFIGKPAPQFELPTLKNPEVSIGSTDFEGDYAVVNVWATWCVMCRVEHGFLLELGADGSVPIYGINWRDPQGQGTRWLRVWGNPFTANGFDFEGRTVIDLGVSAAPETFIIDQQGIIRYRHEGAVTPKIWEEEMYPLIQELQK